MKTIEKYYADLKAIEKLLIYSQRSIANYVAKIPFGTEKFNKKYTEVVKTIEKYFLLI